LIRAAVGHGEAFQDGTHGNQRDHTMNVIKIAAAAVSLLVCLGPAGAQSYNGISCDDVRALSSAERNYWSKRLNLSAEQRHRIYVACYRKQFRGHDHGADIRKSATNAVN
jgi:hypothetical protein